jgi:hypothetical protein
MTAALRNRRKEVVQDCKPDSDGGLNVDRKMLKAMSRFRMMSVSIGVRIDLALIGAFRTRTKVQAIERQREITADRPVSTD